MNDPIIPISNTDLAALLIALGESSRQLSGDGIAWTKHVVPAMKSISDEIVRRVEAGKVKAT